MTFKLHACTLIHLENTFQIRLKPLVNIVIKLFIKT